MTDGVRTIYLYTVFAVTIFLAYDTNILFS